MVAPIWGLYDLAFLLEKLLSMKVLINKEDFLIWRDGSLILGCEVAEMLDFNGV